MCRPLLHTYRDTVDYEEISETQADVGQWRVLLLTVFPRRNLVCRDVQEQPDGLY